MDFPEVDSGGELVCVRSGSDHALMLRQLPAGNSLLIDMPPEVPSWWDGSQWVAKPAQPSTHHAWDKLAKTWIDPRTPEQIAAQELADVRNLRDAALRASDIEALQAIDALLPESLRTRRQALRDVPAAPNPRSALNALISQPQQ